MNCRGIGIFLCAAAVLCGCSVQKEHAKEENIRLEILAKIDMLKATNGLHIEDTQDISSTQQYFKDEKMMDEQRNHDTDTIQTDIAFQKKELKQYQVRIHSDTSDPSGIDTVLQLKDDILHVYIVNDDNTYEKMQETPATSKDKEKFLSSLLFQKYIEEAKDCFRYQKQEQDANTVYTVELTDKEKFSAYINKTENKQEDIHFEELKLSYTANETTILKTDMKQRYRTSQDIQEQEYNRISTETTLHKTQRIAATKQAPEFLKLK